MTRRHEGILSKTCPRVKLFTTNLKWIKLESKKRTVVKAFGDIKFFKI